MTSKNLQYTLLLLIHSTAADVGELEADLQYTLLLLIPISNSPYDFKIVHLQYTLLLLIIASEGNQVISKTIYNTLCYY